MELLLVIALIATTSTILIFGQRLQILRGFDAVKKSDLNRIKVASENYFSDKGCYPPQTFFDNCNGADLQPYLNKIPCDPETKQPYQIQLDGSTCSQKFYLSAIASNTKDPGIICNDKFYVTSANVTRHELLAIICTNSSSCNNGYYACITGNCTFISNVDKPDCAPLFCESNCQNSCGLPGFEVQPQPCNP